MFSNQTKNTLTTMIKDIVKGEKELEHLRQVLVNHLIQNQIGLANCFNHISFEKAIISQEDLETFLQNQQIRYDKNEITYFQYSSFQHFLDLLLPNSQLSLKQLNQKEMHLNLPITDTLTMIGKIFNKNIEIIRRIKAYIDSLLLRYDKNQLLNYLCPVTVKGQPTFLQLLKNLDLDISLEDIICVMRRVDRDEDSDIKEHDWMDWMRGMVQKKRQGSRSTLRSNKSSVASLPRAQQKENQSYQMNQIQPSIPQSVLNFQLHLLNMGKMNEELDEIKLELSARADYSVESAFLFLDINMDNEIDESDLKLSFMQLSIQCTPDIIRMILIRNSQSKIALDLNDLRQIFPPQLNQQQKAILSNQLSYETKKLIKYLLIKFIGIIQYKQDSIEQFNNIKEIEQIYNYIDNDSDGIITLEDLLKLEIKHKYAQQFCSQTNRNQMNLKHFIQYFEQ